MVGHRPEVHLVWRLPGDPKIQYRGAPTGSPCERRNGPRKGAPRRHRHSCFGVLAPNAPLRAAVTSLAGPAETPASHTAATSDAVSPAPASASAQRAQAAQEPLHRPAVAPRLGAEMAAHDEQVLALLVWFGLGAGNWNNFPAYEALTIRLLPRYRTRFLTEVQWVRVAPLQQLGFLQAQEEGLDPAARRLQVSSASGRKGYWHRRERPDRRGSVQSMIGRDGPIQRVPARQTLDNVGTTSREVEDEARCAAVLWSVVEWLEGGERESVRPLTGGMDDRRLLFSFVRRLPLPRADEGSTRACGQALDKARGRKPRNEARPFSRSVTLSAF
ncbi:MAG: hypothetical protein E6Q92_10435 [Burkholderiaceae bacterium]|nr:MAG: hypothetical protein E6Q92_10435 [Burkholderiaceae bacterium]